MLLGRIRKTSENTEINIDIYGNTIDPVQSL